MHRAALANAYIRNQGPADVPTPEVLPEKPQGTVAHPEAEEEAKLRSKYGGALPKRKTIQKEQQFFDSADWALSKSGEGKEATLAPSALAQPPRPLERRASGENLATTLH